MKDSYNRQINYLRVSVTDKCNLRCVYCMPEEGVPFINHKEILRFEEILRLLSCWAGMGLNKIRLTGGEPLVRPGITEFVRSVVKISGVEEVTLTTNGTLLPKYAPELKKAGLSRVNISLDTLVSEKYRYITRRGNLEDVWRGIDAALESGLTPVKLNVVVVRGFNDDEVAGFVDIAHRLSLEVRFIELMPLGESSMGWKEKFVPAEEIKLQVKQLSVLNQAEKTTGNGPARVFELEQGGRVGFISAFSDHFCEKCNRLRLTADGRLRLCLHNRQEIDVKSLLREGANEEELGKVLMKAVQLKPRRHILQREIQSEGRIMSQIGG